MRAEAVRRRSRLEALLARVARGLAHPLFFAAEAAFHVAWVVLNGGWLPVVEPWDPFPFPLLGGIASVQALFIGLLILMYQEREAEIGELREETDLQVALHTERETTELIQLVLDVHRALGIRSRENPEELGQMAEPLDPERLQSSMEDQLREADSG